MRRERFGSPVDLAKTPLYHYFKSPVFFPWNSYFHMSVNENTNAHLRMIIIDQRQVNQLAFSLKHYRFSTSEAGVDELRLSLAILDVFSLSL